MIWIARDKNNDLYLYENKPTLKNEKYWCDLKSIGGYLCKINNTEYPSITFELGPIQLHI